MVAHPRSSCRCCCWRRHARGTYNESGWAGSTSIFTATQPSEKPSGASVELNSMRILPAPTQVAAVFSRYDLEDQPAQAALAANLYCLDYVRIVCGTLEQLPRAFAELDHDGIKETSPLQRSNRDSGLMQHIRALVAGDRIFAWKTGRMNAQDNELATEM